MTKLLFYLKYIYRREVTKLLIFPSGSGRAQWGPESRSQGGDETFPEVSLSSTYTYVHLAEQQCQWILSMPSWCLAEDANTKWAQCGLQGTGLLFRNALQRGVTETAAMSAPWPLCFRTSPKNKIAKLCPRFGLLCKHDCSHVLDRVNAFAASPSIPDVLLLNCWMPRKKPWILGLRIHRRPGSGARQCWCPYWVVLDKSLPRP